MSTFKKVFTCLLMGVLTPSIALAGNMVSDFMDGEASGSFRLRFENADADDGTKDSAQALTLRTRLLYHAKGMNGISAHFEFEDVRALLGVNDYFDKGVVSNGKTNYDTIADPEMTELNEAYLKYNTNSLEIKAGKQRIVYDNMRFVGHVGWRQDDQTFDALKGTYTSGDMVLSAAYIDQVNGINGDYSKIDKNDVLINTGFKLGGMGKLSGYVYQLDNKDLDEQLGTYGVRFKGKTDVGLPVNYTAEFATQTKETTTAADRDATYLLIEGGATMAGVNATLGMETLGSDDGAYGFSTDLATKHAFNGWADIFLGTPSEGLQDIYVKVGTKVAGVKLLGVYHDFSADDDSITGADDFGDELDLLAVKKLENGVTLGFKYATYSAGDAATGKVDTDKVWLWTQVSF